MCVLVVATRGAERLHRALQPGEQCPLEVRLVESVERAVLAQTIRRQSGLYLLHQQGVGRVVVAVAAHSTRLVRPVPPVPTGQPAEHLHEAQRVLAEPEELEEARTLGLPVRQFRRTNHTVELVEGAAAEMPERRQAREETAACTAAAVVAAAVERRLAQVATVPQVS